jgi:hypothetical protein
MLDESPKQEATTLGGSRKFAFEGQNTAFLYVPKETNKDTQPKDRELQLWKPELDTEFLNQQDVPEHWRVSKEIHPGNFAQQFWVDNKGKKQTGASSTM